MNSLFGGSFVGSALCSCLKAFCLSNILRGPHCFFSFSSFMPYPRLVCLCRHTPSFLAPSPPPPSLLAGWTAGIFSSSVNSMGIDAFVRTYFSKL